MLPEQGRQRFFHRRSEWPTFDRKSVAEMAGIVATEGRAKYNAYSVNGDRDIYKGLTFWSPNVNIFVIHDGVEAMKLMGKIRILQKNLEFPL